MTCRLAILRRAMLRRCLLYVFLVAVTGCMEGNKPEKERQERTVSLYERLGREAGITKVVDDFVAAVIKNEKIRPQHKTHFQHGDVAGLKRKLVEQIGVATGGPQKYTGKNMKDAHAGLGITKDDFAALVDSLIVALKKTNVGDKEQQELLGLLGTMKDDVIEVK